MSDKDMALPSDRAASPSGLSPSGSSQSGIPSAEVMILTPERQPGEDLRTHLARTIALHGLGTSSGSNRWCPPNLSWETREWERRVLGCIPGDAERKCFLLADVLLHASAMSAFGQDPQGLEAKPASATGKAGDAK